MRSGPYSQPEVRLDADADEEKPASLAKPESVPQSDRRTFSNGFVQDTLRGVPTTSIPQGMLPRSCVEGLVHPSAPVGTTKAPLGDHGFGKSFKRLSVDHVSESQISS